MPTLILAMILVTTFAAQVGASDTRTSEYSSASIREEQNVIVEGFSETWRLQWTEAPKPYREPTDVSLTCPCMGFAYGEVGIMHFADYDHDGGVTEFYLQTESAPRGRSIGVVVGLSKSEPRLHMFTTICNPQKPLYLQKREWDALRYASSGTIEVEDWACGDHGAETQTDLLLRWSAKGIDGVRREYTCPVPGETRRLNVSKREATEVAGQKAKRASRS